jgi:hypothetical protein
VKPTRIITLLGFLCFFGLPVMAQDAAGSEDELKGWPRWTIQLGVIDLDTNPRIGVRNDDYQPPLVDFERFGFTGRETSGWLRTNWRFGEYWSAEFSAYRYDNSTTRVIDEEFEFDETVYPVNATVASQLQTDLYVFNLYRSIFRNKKTDIGIGGGFYFVDLDVSLDIQGSGPQPLASSRNDFLAPLPNVVGYANFRLSPRWTWRNRLGWFGLDYDDYSGDMVTLLSSVELAVHENWGVGLGYSLVDLSLDVEEGPRTTTFNIDYDGPYAFITFDFD